MTKSAVKKAIKRDELLINGVIATSCVWMKTGDVVALIDNQNRILKAFPLDVEIVFEDSFFVIVNKPSGLVVSGNLFRTLENAMVGQIETSTAQDRNRNAKPVHRLDAATSGLVIMSKTAAAHRRLAKLFEERLIQKTYHAVVSGRCEGGVINDEIKGQISETFIEVKSVIDSLRSENLSLVRLSPKTGRTHQLRIHCSEKGNPIVGDVLYGEEGNTLLDKGLFLAATKLSFKHPMNNKAMEIEIPIPHKFYSLLEREERRWLKFKGHQE